MSENPANTTSIPERNNFRIKVCGMTLPEQVHALDEMGVDLAGFIFYPKSPRYVGNKLSAAAMKQIKGRIAKVGVFVNTPYEEMMQTVEDYRLDMVQLHGDESAFFCEKVANYVTVIKAFRLTAGDPIDWMVRPFHDGSDMYMFDTMGAGYGGTGKKFDWSVLSETQIDKLYFLSGGLEPGDETAIKRFAAEDAGKKMFAIDINSRFEISPGVKDLNKVKDFVANIKK